ncbi:MAG: GNAT family N-acetyltransferase [Candidatus Diapherotrites archaeon]|nr:GNAT family N-acetyltransferase [Candidatus Diapherotrites archaeon]
MIIKKINPQDIGRIVELSAAEFPYKNHSSQKVSERQKNGAMLFKAEENGSFAGFVDFELQGNKGFIHGLAVRKEYRGKKIGRTLAVFAIHALSLNGAEKIRLLVRRENDAAKKIYEKLGFRHAGTGEKTIAGEPVEELELNVRNEFFS